MQRFALNALIYRNRTVAKRKLLRIAASKLGKRRPVTLVIKVRITQYIHNFTDEKLAIFIHQTLSQVMPVTSTRCSNEAWKCQTRPVVEVETNYAYRVVMGNSEERSPG